MLARKSPFARGRRFSQRCSIVDHAAAQVCEKIRVLRHVRPSRSKEGEVSGQDRAEFPIKSECCSTSVMNAATLKDHQTPAAHTQPATQIQIFEIPGRKLRIKERAGHCTPSDHQAHRSQVRNRRYLALITAARGRLCGSILE